MLESLLDISAVAVGGILGYPNMLGKKISNSAKTVLAVTPAVVQGGISLYLGWQYGSEYSTEWGLIYAPMGSIIGFAVGGFETALGYLAGKGIGYVVQRDENRY